MRTLDEETKMGNRIAEIAWGSSGQFNPRLLVQVSKFRRYRSGRDLQVSPAPKLGNSGVPSSLILLACQCAPLQRATRRKSTKIARWNCQGTMAPPRRNYHC